MAQRRGRGIDFEHRFNTSRWAEDLLLETIAHTSRFHCFRLGLSQVARNNLVTVEESQYKVPDLVVFRAGDLTTDQLKALRSRDLTLLSASTLFADRALMKTLKKAACAIEVEFSPYRATEMKGRHWQPKDMESLQKRQRKHANPPVAPNIWIKHEDMPRLLCWQRDSGIPIVVAHLFDQEVFATSLHAVDTFARKMLRLSASPHDVINAQLQSGIFSKEQSYDRQDAQGAREVKKVFIVTPAAATKVGDLTGVKVEAQVGLSASRKYVAHTLFSGGKLSLSPQFLALLADPQ